MLVGQDNLGHQFGLSTSTPDFLTTPSDPNDHSRLNIASKTRRITFGPQVVDTFTAAFSCRRVQVLACPGQRAHRP